MLGAIYDSEKNIAHEKTLHTEKISIAVHILPAQEDYEIALAYQEYIT
jgi:hypothetical protein